MPTPGELSIQHKIGRSILLARDAARESATNGHVDIAKAINEYVSILEDLEDQITKRFFTEPVVIPAHRTKKRKGSKK